MRKTFGHLPLVFMVTSLFGTNSPSYAQSVERPAYVIVATMTPRGEAVLQNISGRFSTKGFKTKIAPVADRIALLVGPYTSPDDFNAAVELVTAAWRERAQKSPFFFENAPTLASSSRQNVAFGSVTSSPEPQPSAEDTLKWINEFAAGRKGAKTEYSDKLEFSENGIRWNYNGNLDNMATIYLKDVRSINKRVGGSDNQIWIEVVGTVESCFRHFDSDGYHTSCHTTLESTQVHFGEDPTIEDAQRFVKALTHLAELLGADMKLHNLF